MNFIIIILIVITILNWIYAENCTIFETCGECVGNTLGCVWCSDKTIKGPRCESASIIKKTPKWCQNVMNPGKSIKTEDPPKKAQFGPQKIKIQARPGDTLTFTLNYKPELDYPVDIYYLMDNSYSMNFYKNKLVDQAVKIRNKLKNDLKANNIQFGCGSFVEKLELPFANPKIHKPNNFINHLKLDGNIDNFVHIVKHINYTSNWDIPEAVLDGLMQSIICENTIGWRNNSRRMLIVSTESTYHSAGDGKFVGAYKPNDMKCHLHNNQYQSNVSLLYDYPSVSQIDKVASEKGISIFFAVMKNVKREYLALAERIQGAKYAELKNDPGSSSNDLVDMIADEYSRLVQTLVIDRGFIPPYIEVKLDKQCTKNNTCGIPNKGRVEIKASVTVKSCPANNKHLDTLKFKPVGILETAEIDVEVLCQCECEKKGKGTPNAPECSSGNGTYQCGVCKCNKNRYGKTCQCSGTSTENLDLEKCKAKNSTKLCSGRGVCSCGKCSCVKENGYYGDFCEYGDHECPTFDDLICAGKGKCLKNKCDCDQGWAGSDCTCLTDTDPCVGANNEVCSGNGKCKCGECKCTKYDKNNKRYTGEFCDLCDGCIEDQCKQLGGYVQCVFDGNKETCDGKFNVTTNRTVVMLTKNETNNDDRWGQANYCPPTVLADFSSIVFKYSNGHKSSLILIQKEKIMPPEADIWVPIGSAIGVILLIGILTLIAWKVLVDIHDQREYNKFLEESKANGFDVSENPLYEPPAVIFNNPTYNS